jgi:hypothetical protein
MAKHKVIGLDNYVNYLTDANYRVRGMLEYSTTDIKTKEWGYGATLEIKDWTSGDVFYTHIHFHCPMVGKKVNVKSICAHFKEGKAKGASQSWNLPPWDAYAILIGLRVAKLEEGVWKEVKLLHVSLAKVKELIKANDLDTLNTIFHSKLYALNLWEKEAWTLFLEWNSGMDVSGQL